MSNKQMKFGKVGFNALSNFRVRVSNQFSLAGDAGRSR